MSSIFIIVVEKKRKQMVEEAFRHGFLSKRTIATSQHLDKLMNLTLVPELNYTKNMSA